MAELTDEDYLKGLYKKAIQTEESISEMKNKLLNIHKAIEAFGGSLDYMTLNSSSNVATTIKDNTAYDIDFVVNWKDITWREKAEFALLHLNKPATVNEIIDSIADKETLDKENLRKRLTNALSQNEGKYFKFKQISGRKRAYSLIKKTTD